MFNCAPHSNIPCAHETWELTCFGRTFDMYLSFSFLNNTQSTSWRCLPCPQSQIRIFPRDYTSHVWKVKAHRFAQLLSQSTSWPTRAISSTEMLRTILGTCQELHCVFSTWHRLEGMTKHDETVMKLLQANWGSVVQFLFGAFRSQWGELGFLVAEYLSACAW